MAHWRDMDPLQPTDLASYIDCFQQGGAASYFGRSNSESPRLELRVEQSAGTGLWAVELAIYDPWRNPEVFTWSGILIPPHLPFDTGLLQEVIVPGLDFRLCKAMQ